MKDIFGGKERELKTRDALMNPKVGDLFDEMCSYWMQVTDVTDSHVTFIDNTGDARQWTEPQILSREGFISKFSYGGKSEGFWVSLNRREEDE